MTLSHVRATVCAAILCAACIVPAGALLAQAPAGPLPPSHPLPPPPPPPPAKKKPQVEPRKSLAGYWKLNKDESDDARQRLEDARKTQAGGPSAGGPGGGMGGPRIGVGYPCMGCGPMGGPYPGGGGPSQRGDDTYDSEQMWELIRPQYSQNVILSDNEVDSSDEHGDKVVYYTDGRKLTKSKDKDKDANTSLLQVSAQWKGQQLVTDERGPKNRKISRTFELSADGRQFTETWRLEGARQGSAPITIRYVYDAASEYND